MTLRLSSLPHSVLLMLLMTAFSGCAVQDLIKPSPTKTTATQPAATESKPITPVTAAVPSVTNEATPAQATLAATALADGIALYDKGEFNAAIKKLSGADDIWRGDKAGKLAAHKYLAFSYCVTKRRTLCRKQFQKALRLDPGFDLAPGEKGHPLWTPEFERAKKQKAGRG